MPKYQLYDQDPIQNREARVFNVSDMPRQYEHQALANLMNVMVGGRYYIARMIEQNSDRDAWEFPGTVILKFDTEGVTLP